MRLRRFSTLSLVGAEGSLYLCPSSGIFDEDDEDLRPSTLASRFMTNNLDMGGEGVSTLESLCRTDVQVLV